MLIVADSSALIALAICDSLVLLDQLFDEIKVPQAVFDEVIIEGKPVANKLKAYLRGKVAFVDLTAYVINAGGLGRGELEAMALYRYLPADYLLVDDRRARKVAKINQMTITGSQGILLFAKQQGLITHVKPFLDQLRFSNIRISERMITKTLNLAGEL
jgi:uncharacterized protein